MFKAKDIMTRDLITVTLDTQVYEAARILIKNDITGLPVISDDMVPLGIITEKDMLKLLSESNPEHISITDIMTREVTCFDENDPVIDICECLIKNNFRRVPILSRGKLVGIISRTDIIGLILQARKQK